MFEIWRFKTDALSQLRGHRLLPLLLIAFILFVQNFIPLPRAEVPEVVENGLLWSYGLDWNLEQIQSIVANSLGRQDFIRAAIKVICIILAAAMNIALFRFFLFFAVNSTTTTFNTFLEGLNFCLKSILASIYVNLRLFLWSLLILPAGAVILALSNAVNKEVVFAGLLAACILPMGILVWKSIQYSQFFFILAEYPHVGVTKALKTSVIITRGYCGKLFLFFLSFTGWAFLSALTFGVGLLFLLPYIYTAWGNSYRFLKNNAFDAGLLIKKGANDG